MSLHFSVFQEMHILLADISSAGQGHAPSKVPFPLAASSGCFLPGFLSS